MKKTENRFTRFLALGIGFYFALMLGFANTVMAGDQSVACTGADQFEQEITSDAELLDFGCFFKKWKNAKSLHFKVKIKNISDKEQRFRVNIFLDNGKAVGGLLPRKTKKGLIQPGQSVEYAYPVRGMAEKPEGVFLRIRTMGS